MILVFTGCRYGAVDGSVLDYLLDKYVPRIVRVGDALGVDQCVRQHFFLRTALGVEGDLLLARPEEIIPALEVYSADWDAHGKAAGPIRNREMVRGADQVVAFWDGDSRGTLDCIKTAVRMRVPVEIVPL